MNNERYKYPPVDALDIKEIEVWLEEMAGRGLFLKEAGPYAWLFAEEEPKTVRYRIEPAAGKKGKLDADRQADYEAMGWHYVAKYNTYYHIFMADHPETEELHTDRIVESFSLKMLEKKIRKDLVFLAVLWAFIAVDSFFSSTHFLRYPVLSFIELRPAVILYRLFMAAWFFKTLFLVLKVHKLRKMLAEGIPVKVKKVSGKRIRKKRIGHTLERIGIGFLIAGLVLSFFPERMGEPLEQAMKAGRFLTLELLEERGGEEGAVRAAKETEEEGESGGTVWQRFNILTAGNYELYERDADKKTDAPASSLHVQYFRMRFPCLTGALFSEVQRKYISGTLTAGDPLTAENALGAFTIVYGIGEDGTQAAAARQEDDVILIEYSGPEMLKEKTELIGELLVSERRRRY